MSKKNKPVEVPYDEYWRMRDQLQWLQCLEDAGVDNWSGIDEAIRLRNEMRGDDDE